MQGLHSACNTTGNQAWSSQPSLHAVSHPTFNVPKSVSIVQGIRKGERGSDTTALPRLSFKLQVSLALPPSLLIKFCLLFSLHFALFF